METFLSILRYFGVIQQPSVASVSRYFHKAVNHLETVKANSASAIDSCKEQIANLNDIHNSHVEEINVAHHFQSQLKALLTPPEASTQVS